MNASIIASCLTLLVLELAIVIFNEIDAFMKPIKNVNAMAKKTTTKRNSAEKSIQTTNKQQNSSKISAIEKIEELSNRVVNMTPALVIKDAISGKSQEKLTNIAQTLELMSSDKISVADLNSLRELIDENHRINGTTKSYAICFSKQFQLVLNAIINKTGLKFNNKKAHKDLNEEINELYAKHAENLASLDQEDPSFADKFKALNEELFAKRNNLERNNKLKSVNATQSAKIRIDRKINAHIFTQGLKSILSEANITEYDDLINSTEFQLCLLTEKDREMKPCDETTKYKNNLKRVVKIANMTEPGIEKYLSASQAKRVEEFVKKQKVTQ